MTALIALLEVSAESSGAANLDCSQDAALRARDPVAVLLEEGFAVPRDNIGDF